MGETTGTRSSTWWTRPPRHPHADAGGAPAYPAVCVCAAVLGVVIVSKNIRGSSVTVISVTLKNTHISHISQLYQLCIPMYSPEVVPCHVLPDAKAQSGRLSFGSLREVLRDMWHGPQPAHPSHQIFGVFKGFS